MSLRDTFQTASAQLMRTVGDPATYVTGAGARKPITAALAESNELVGEFGETSAVRPAIDVLKSEVAMPVQGDEIQFADSTWVVDGIASSDGYFLRLWVSEP